MEYDDITANETHRVFQVSSVVTSFINSTLGGVRAHFQVPQQQQDEHQEEEEEEEEKGRARRWLCVEDDDGVQEGGNRRHVAMRSFLARVFRTALPHIVQRAHRPDGRADADYAVSQSPVSLQLPLHLFLGRCFAKLLALQASCSSRSRRRSRSGSGGGGGGDSSGGGSSGSGGGGGSSGEVVIVVEGGGERGGGVYLLLLVLSFFFL